MAQENETLTASLEELLRKLDLQMVGGIGSLTNKDPYRLEAWKVAIVNQAMAILLGNMTEVTPKMLNKVKPLVMFATFYNKVQFWLVAKDRQNHALDVLWAFDAIRRSNMFLEAKDRESFTKDSKEYAAVLGLLCIEDKQEALLYADLALQSIYDRLPDETIQYLNATSAY